jgi:hypothetical protein
VLRVIGKRLSSSGIQVTVGLSELVMWMPWLGRDQAAHSLVPNQQFESHPVLVGLLLNRCTRNPEHWAAAPSMR